MFGHKEVPMPKPRTTYVCQQCGYQSSRWMGRCPECDAWDSLVETQQEEERRGTTPVSLAGAAQPQSLAEVSTDGYERMVVPIEEFNRVLGGGIVPGSLVLISGDPGIGKSTLLSAVSALIAERGDAVLYVSAEESAQQVKLRAQRLGHVPPALYVLSETNLDRILLHIEQMSPALVIVDSIQSVYLEALSSAAGSVSQVREGAAVLMRLAKERHIPVFLVGHVTKTGAIAGPRVLEHIVDAVLYLEGDRFHQYRLLRGVKNRFGSTFEVGVFEMSSGGMVEVANPSAVFLSERSPTTPGSTVVVTMEGTRPILVEVQALTATTSLALPRRTANGIETSRLLMLTAVLSKRVGLTLGNQDIYVNVVGGMRVHEPAADLGVAVAIASVFRNATVDPEMAMMGEIGLSGELRSVAQLERRIQEAAKLGFKRTVYPRGARKPSVPEGFEAIGVRSVGEALDIALQR
jgi:DNA repair protein RadA/Sms